jgi:WD40 repeat protein
VGFSTGRRRANHRPHKNSGHLEGQQLPAQVKKPGAIFRAPGSYTLAVALTANGKLLARGGADNAVDLWDVASGKKLHALKGHTVPIMRLAFSPDGKTLASITGNLLPNDVLGEVKLWDVATGKERVSLKCHPNKTLSLAFSSDGKILATSSETVKLWDVATGKEKMELRVSERPWELCAWSLAFSPDGKTLATGMGRGPMDITPSSVILWEVSTGKQRATLPGHANSITWVGFAPDGKTLASASGGIGGGLSEGLEKWRPGQLKLWDVATAKDWATIAIPGYPAHQFFSLAFAADGKTLICAMRSFGESADEGGYAVRHWELITGKAGATFWAPVNAGGHNAGI